MLSLVILLGSFYDDLLATSVRIEDNLLFFSRIATSLDILDLMQLSIKVYMLGMVFVKGILTVNIS